MGNKYISWRRVSTFKQSRSGLGLEAQKEIIRYFVQRDGGVIIADYSECYTGKELSGCVELQKAMAHAKKEKAILVIAKSDRFRNCQEALLILNDMGEGNIEFCDLPHSDRFTLTLFWALAEREALITSIRTKQALAAKKARGAKLGGANEKHRETMAAKSDEEKQEIQMKKGKLKSQRYLEGRDQQAFIRVLRNVFPTATKGDDLKIWRWGLINCKAANAERMLAIMADYKELDHEGKLFAKWNFSDETASKKKLTSYLQAFRKSVLKENI